MPVFIPAFFQPEAYNCEEVMVKTRIRNRLAETRKRRGVGAAGLAGRVGVSRQTIYAIEAGTYVPDRLVGAPIGKRGVRRRPFLDRLLVWSACPACHAGIDRKSTRLNSSHRC